MAVLLIIFTMVFVLGPIAKALAERISRPLPGDGESQRLELARMREEIDRLTQDVARLQDEQSFMVSLLNEGDRQKLLDEKTSPGS